jgi:hypothetical protein
MVFVAWNSWIDLVISYLELGLPTLRQVTPKLWGVLVAQVTARGDFSEGYFGLVYMFNAACCLHWGRLCRS